MGILRREALALLLVVMPSISHAECLRAVCNGETTRLYVSINGENPPDPEEGVVLVVLATPLGSCDAAVVVTPEPIPYVEPPIGYFDDYVVDIPTPFDGAPTRYEIYRRYPDGSLVRPPTCGDPLPVDTEGCADEWLVGRARVTGWVILPHPPFLQREYTFCTDGCWIEVPLSIGAGTVVDDVGVGSYVEIYGKLFESGMPGETRIDVSRVVEIVDAGTCGVVSSPTQSWGALKSRFD